MATKQKSRRKEEWRELIRKSREYKGTIAQWCQENGINVATYKYWVTQFNKETKNESSSQPVVFAELSQGFHKEIKPHKADSAHNSNIIIRCGLFEIEVNNHTDFLCLPNLLAVVKTLC